MQCRKISIIVPVYKVEGYLHRCVDSILAQTYPNIEVILVDDGSPDRCGQICEEYAQKDSRIHVIHKENGGLSDARNAGLDWVAANSDASYISFVDSDDYLHPQMYEKLLEAALREDSDLVACRFVRLSDEPPAEYPAYAEPEGITSIDSATALDGYYEYYFDFIGVSAWAKLYQRSVFETLRYRKGIILEDQDLFPQVLATAKKITVLPYPFYYYYVTPNSIVNCGFNPKYIETPEAHVRHIAYFLQLGRQKQADQAAFAYIRSLILTYRDMRKLRPELTAAFWQQTKKTYASNRAYIRKHCHLTRLQLLILDIFPRFPNVALRLYAYITR